MLWSLACAPPETSVAAPVAAEAAPAVEAPVAGGLPAGSVHKVYLDAGHGAEGNPGNRGVLCRDEQDVTLEIARAVGDHLVATGRFDVRLSRLPGQRVAYPARVAEAAAWGAEAFVSLHTDARGAAWSWAVDAHQSCLRNDDDPGFTVLWSDEHAEKTPARRRLAEAVAARMRDAGFEASRGVHYTGLYEEGEPGVFVDRHAPSRRIMVLRRPAMPSVIVETHHALDLEEARSWADPRTVERFAGALAAGLLDALAAPETPPD